MKLKYSVLACILFGMITSCNLIHIKPGKVYGLFSGYNATQKHYPGLLVKTDASTPLCDLRYSEEPKVYVIKGEQLKQCLMDYDDAIVYIWSPHCGGDQCFSPSLLQKLCKEKKVELFVVAEYYTGEDLVQFYELDRPMFGIDTRYYKTDIVDMYLPKFENDLSAKKEAYGRMLYFKKGKYVGRPEIEFEEQ